MTFGHATFVMARPRLCDLITSAVIRCNILEWSRKCGSISFHERDTAFVLYSGARCCDSIQLGKCHAKMCPRPPVFQGKIPEI